MSSMASRTTNPRHPWRERDFLTRPTIRRPRRPSLLRLFYDTLLDRLSAPKRAAEAAEARRAARCEEANEPWLASGGAERDRHATFETVAAPAFESSPQSLSADRFAPSQHPEIEPFEIPLSAARATHHHNDERRMPTRHPRAVR
jgi:hypothetical protein